MAATIPAHGTVIASPKTPTDADRLLGQRITALRKAAGLSQTALGGAIGVTFQQVQKYEAGKNRVGAGRLLTLAETLGVPVTVLLGQDEAGTVSGDVVALLTETGAADLLRAYAMIPSTESREALIRTARALGGAVQARAA